MLGEKPDCQLRQSHGLQGLEGRDLGSAGRGKEGRGGVNKGVLCLFVKDILIYIYISRYTDVCVHMSIQRY